MYDYKILIIMIILRSPDLALDETLNFDVLWVHLTSLGSGSHSPFHIQIDELGPMNTHPRGQTKSTVVPSVVTLE